MKYIRGSYTYAVRLLNSFVLRLYTSYFSVIYYQLENFTFLMQKKSIFQNKVEIFLEQREVAFLSPSKICEDLNFSREIQIFANFAG